MHNVYGPADQMAMQVLSAMDATIDTSAMAVYLLLTPDHSALPQFAGAHGTRAVDKVVGERRLPPGVREDMDAAAAIAFTDGCVFGMEYSAILTGLLQPGPFPQNTSRGQ